MDIIVMIYNLLFVDYTIHKMGRYFIREETCNLEHCPNIPSFHFTFAENAAYEKKYGGRLEV